MYFWIKSNGKIERISQKKATELYLKQKETTNQYKLVRIDRSGFFLYTKFSYVAWREFDQIINMFKEASNPKPSKIEES